MAAQFLILAGLGVANAAGPDGLARTPPMGWRSWNAFGRNINQSKMQEIMDVAAARTRTVNGAPTSLLDLGYINMGLDDNWQDCGAGNLSAFHNTDGLPVVNLDRFPDMHSMVDYAHSLGLHAGWYLNNCICHENGVKDPEAIDLIYRGNVQAMHSYGFDSVKLDSCSEFKNISFWADLMRESGKPTLVENCMKTHYPTDPSAVCPYNFWRVSGDIGPSWGQVMENLHAMRPYLGDKPLSRPGCWAYADMLEVANWKATFEEDRAHFGAWCITSSPLILSFDLRDTDRMDRAWDAVTNEEAIAVNQNWAGHPGRLVQALPGPASGHFLFQVECDELDATQGSWQYDAQSQAVVLHDLCLDNSLELQPCNGSQVQRFNMTDGHIADCQGDCVDVSGRGPGVSLKACKSDQENQKFSLTNGRIRSQAPVAPASMGRCLTARQELPSMTMPPQILQVWAKPQPNNSVAVLVLSNGIVNSSVVENGTIILDFAELGLPTVDNIFVRDIWAKVDVGTFSGSFKIDAFSGHDSRFYVFSVGKPSCRWFQNTGISTGDIERVAAPTKEDCCEACSSAARCTAAVFTDGVCHFKKGFGMQNLVDGRMGSVACVPASSFGSVEPISV